MAFWCDFREFRNQLRNACHSGLVHGAVFTLIDSHDHHHENVILNPINQPIALFSEFDFVVTGQGTMQFATWHMRVIQAFFQ